jgi:Zn-dependent oligopeptidase
MRNYVKQQRTAKSKLINFIRIYSKTPNCITIKNTKATDPIDQKYRQDILDQFEDTGIQLEPAKRARMKAILDELTKLNKNITVIFVITRKT